MTGILRGLHDLLAGDASVWVAPIGAGGMRSVSINGGGAGASGPARRGV